MREQWLRHIDHYIRLMMKAYSHQYSDERYAITASEFIAVEHKVYASDIASRHNVLWSHPTFIDRWAKLLVGNMGTPKTRWFDLKEKK